MALMRPLIRQLSLDEVRTLFLVLAALSTASGWSLSAALQFPDVLLDKPSFGTSLVRPHALTALVGFGALIVSGFLLFIVSRAVAPSFPTRWRRMPLVLGGGAAGCWAIGALLGIVLMLLWATDNAAAVPTLAALAFVLFAVVAPLLLAMWTALLSWKLGATILGALGTLGLLATFFRSLVWIVNTQLPVEDGLYLTSALLTVAAVVGFPVWIVWLVRMGFRSGAAAAHGQSRRKVLTLAKKMGGALMVVAIVAAHAGVSVSTTPIPTTDDTPAVTSAGGAAAYLMMITLSKFRVLSLPSTYSENLDERARDFYTHAEVPRDVSRTLVDALGVPAEFLCAEGASRERVILYLHGDGFTLPPNNSARTWVASISRTSRACVLMPQYRLAPEHPFPAALHDCVTSYRWLLRQDLAATRVVIIGDSAGGNLTLGTALSLRDSGDALPAALVSLSPVTDFTLSGDSFHTHTERDPLLTRGPVEFTVRSYTDNRKVNLRDPLLSPLFADLKGLPPVLLLVGSQEVLLSDAIRFAEALRIARVPVTFEIWRGMPHAWWSAIPEIMEAKLTVDHISAFVVNRTR